MLAEIISDSVNVVTNDRLTTFLLPRFPYVLLQEPATHRMLYGEHLDEPLVCEPLRKFSRDFSMNAASSRAIPILRVIESVRQDPYIPAWTQNQKGMAGKDGFTEQEKALLTKEWLEDMEYAISAAERRYEQGVAKQDTNRGLIPFMRIPILITATEWDNFFKLRTASDVQPDFRAVALEMQRLYQESEPKKLYPGSWHIPFIQADDLLAKSTLSDRLKVSSARSARLSYWNHLGETDADSDFRLHDRLVTEVHMSPLEHQAKALPLPARCRNLTGWMQYRVHVEEKLPLLEIGSSSHSHH